MFVWGCRCGAFGGLLYEVEGNISLQLWPPNQKVFFSEPADVEFPHRPTLAQRLIHLQFP